MRKGSVGVLQKYFIDAKVKRVSLLIFMQRVHVRWKTSIATPKEAISFLIHASDAYRQGASTTLRYANKKSTKKKKNISKIGQIHQKQFRESTDTRDSEIVTKKGNAKSGKTRRVSMK